MISQNNLAQDIRDSLWYSVGNFVEDFVEDFMWYSIGNTVGNYVEVDISIKLKSYDFTK